MPYLEAGIPVWGHTERAAPAHAGCSENSISWLTKGSWNTFPKPQIALRRGWGAPGTDMQVSTFHKMISAFDEVFHHKAEVEVGLTEQELREAAAAAAEEEQEQQGQTSAARTKEEEEEVLDLQLFHRGDGCPAMPALGDQLRWPSYVDDGAVCDTATWVSQAGMVRHWHLNDSGEFVMQVALPLAASSPEEAAVRAGRSGKWIEEGLSPAERRIRSLLCPALSAASSAGQPVAAMLAIFAPKGGYDWMVHDDEATMLGKVVALDLFNTPDDALPCDASVLPILTVAVLESGAAPLLIPPNVTQLSIALADCVVAEQRRVSNLWLDDVSYFLHRCARWQTTPILYAYLQQDLQDDAFLAGQVIPFLVRVFAEHGEATSYHAAVRRRAVCSLFALAANEKHYGLAESTRASLLRLLHGGNVEMQAVLQGAPYTGAPTTASDAPKTLEEWLTVYWSTTWCWPKAGCVLRTPCVVHPLGSKLTPAQGVSYYLPVVYPPSTCSPVYGSEEATIEGTVSQYFEMKHLEANAKDLWAYLRTRKQPPDDLLDELF